MVDFGLPRWRPLLCNDREQVETSFLIARHFGTPEMLVSVNLRKIIIFPVLARKMNETKAGHQAWRLDVVLPESCPVWPPIFPLP